MNWIEKFKAWLTETETPKVTTIPPLRSTEDSDRWWAPGWLEEQPTGVGDAPAVSQDPGEGSSNEPGSDEKNETGEEQPVSEPLRDADDLPGETYRVFPSAINHRNTYDSPRAVRGSVAQRKRAIRDWGWSGPIRVYRATTVWEDVTDEFVLPSA